MQRCLLILATCLLTLSVKAQPADLYFMTRLGYDYTAVPNEGVSDDATGFRGHYLKFLLDANITNKLRLSYRQRLLNINTNGFFNSTDWLQLKWQATPRFALSGGKQIVAIGGYEYDRAPIDLYYCSEFWNNIACYQMGVSASFGLSDNDLLTFQVCNSPMRAWAGNNKYALNAIWYGTHGFWKPIWSLNLFQCADNKNIVYMALGNRFAFTDKLNLDIDFIDRYNPGCGILDDFSLMTELSWAFDEYSRVFIKYTFDTNDVQNGSTDHLVLPGTRVHLASAGFEHSPLKCISKSLKLFAAGGYTWGENTNPDGVMGRDCLYMSAGFKLYFGIFAHK